MQHTGRLAAGLVGLILLAGCAEQRIAEAAKQRIAEAKATQNSEVAACNTQYPAKIGNYRSRAYCFNDALVAFNEKAHDGNDNDMLAVLNATRVILADRVDRGEMSPDDMHLQLVSLQSQQIGQITQRNAQSAAARAAVLIPMMQMQQQQMQQQQFQQQQSRQQLYQQQMNAIRSANFRPNPTVNCSSNMFGNMVSTTCN